MHEMAIAEELMGQVAAVARANGVVRVTEVEVEYGQMRQIVAEALEAAFGAVSENTVAAGARLRQSEVGIVAKCRECGQRFEGKVDCYQCPKCGRADAEIVAGNEIVLKSVTGDTET